MLWLEPTTAATYCFAHALVAKLVMTNMYRLFLTGVAGKAPAELKAMEASQTFRRVHASRWPNSNILPGSITNTID